MDLSRWYDVPILKREHAEANRQTLETTIVPKDVGEFIPDRTSGTGGSVFHFKRSMASQVADSANSLRIFLDYGFDLTSRFADIRIDTGNFAEYPEGQTRENWTFGEGYGEYVLLDINTDISNQVEWLRRKKPNILFTWASNARQLALALEEAGKTLPLTYIGTSADKCSAAVRADCIRVFGCDPIDIFGARELGVIAFSCNKSNLYHLAAESIFVEVVDDGGRPVRPGETGKLVGTDFYNFHMPFIRYETGDYVTLSDTPCECGRSLPAIAEFNGRDRNRFLREDRTFIFPNVPEELLDEHIAPLSWQIAQTEIGRVELRTFDQELAIDRSSLDAIEAAISNGFQEQVTVVVVAGYRNQESRKKYEYFVREMS